MLGLLFGASVYALSIILAVFLVGLGIGSGIGASLCRILASPRLALGWCQCLAACAIAWTAYNLSAALPYWPINPSISSNIWFNFELDLARAFWALLPPTLLWGASFPLALAAAASRRTRCRQADGRGLRRQHLWGHRRSSRREPAPGRLGGIAAHGTSAHWVIDRLPVCSFSCPPNPAGQAVALSRRRGAAGRLLISSPSRPSRKCSSRTAATRRPGWAKAISFTPPKA